MRLRATSMRMSAGARPGWTIHPSAALDMDFAGNRFFGKSLADITLTRASPGYAQDLAGNWLAFGAGVLRRTNLGLLVEGARTNSIRNNSMQGAVAGAPGTWPTNWTLSAGAGLSWAIAGIGSEAGVNYVDVRLSGTATGVSFPSVFMDAITAIATSPGAVWTQSLFISRVGGSIANTGSINHNIYEFDAAQAFLRNTTPAISVGASQTRASATATMGASAAYVRPGIFVYVPGAGAVDITLRIGWPQLELGSYATSPILTTGSAATRAADNTIMNVALAWPLTLFCAATPGSPIANPGSQNFVEVSNGSTVQRAALRRNATSGAGLAALVGGVGANINYATALAAGARAKTSFAIAAGNQAASFNGSLPGTASAATLPNSPTQISIGMNSAATEQLFGYVERIALIPSRITNSELQSLTA